MSLSTATGKQVTDAMKNESPGQGKGASPAESSVENLPSRSTREVTDKETVHAMIDGWFEYRDRAGITLGGLTIREMIDEGRR
jgi:hypothetical protein